MGKNLKSDAKAFERWARSRRIERLVVDSCGRDLYGVLGVPTLKDEQNVQKELGPAPPQFKRWTLYDCDG